MKETKKSPKPRNLKGCGLAALEEINDLSAITKIVHKYCNQLEVSLRPFITGDFSLVPAELKFPVMDTVNQKVVALTFSGNGVHIKDYQSQ